MPKKEIPRCRYCKKKLGFTHSKRMRDLDPETWPPTRGRCGANRWCTLSCLEQSERLHWTGRALRRGDSHPDLKTEGGE